MAMSPLEARNALQAAIAHHQAGRLAEAEALYRRILAGFPRHPDVLHFLGLLAHQRGQHDAALALMDQALREAPGHAPCYSNRGNTLLALGRLDEAVASFRQALALDRNLAEAHLNLGNALHRQGLPDDAVASYRRALLLQPRSAETHYNLGRVYEARGQLADATRSYRRAVALRPDYVEAHFNLGNVLQAAGHPEEAVASYQKVVALKPDHADAHNNLGAQFELAGQLDEAMASYRRALALRHGFPEAHNNLGNALLADGRADEAIASYRAAIAQRPDYAEAHNNLGNALQAAGRLDEAVRSHDRALSLRPGFADARWNKAFALLLQGDFAAGWPLFEARWELLRNHPDVAVFDRPLWLGDAPLAGRTLLVHHEQGLGDTLQMLRYVPLLAAQGARVVLQAPAVLAALAGTVRGVAAVVVPGEPLPAHDLHCPCMSLPLACGTTLATIPAEVPYLAVPESIGNSWRARLEDARSGDGAGPRIGVAWSGSTAHRNDRQRSLALGQLLPLLAMPAEFHSLQKEYRTGDRELLTGNGRLRDWSAGLDTLADTAGLIAQLDLVIAVDTAVAHLAGALGKPVWLLLPAAPDYRWLLARTDSPWYPTMRLFRQPAPGAPDVAWEPVLGDLSTALQTLLRARPSSR
jgi:tetratricopeptide (TPR) repeat protein